MENSLRTSLPRLAAGAAILMLALLVLLGLARARPTEANQPDAQIHGSREPELGRHPRRAGNADAWALRRIGDSARSQPQRAALHHRAAAADSSYGDRDAGTMRSGHHPRQGGERQIEWRRPALRLHLCRQSWPGGQHHDAPHRRQHRPADRVARSRRLPDRQRRRQRQPLQQRAARLHPEARTGPTPWSPGRSTRLPTAGSN